MKITATCRECGRQQAVDVTFGKDAQVTGPVEKCHPGYDDSISPTECEACEAPFDLAAMVEQAAEELRDAQDSESDWKE